MTTLELQAADLPIVWTRDGVRGLLLPTGVIPWDRDGWPHVIWDGDPYLCVLAQDEIRQP